jgi:hypothetical protein
LAVLLWLLLVWLLDLFSKQSGGWDDGQDDGEN